MEETNRILDQNTTLVGFIKSVRRQYNRKINKIKYSILFIVPAYICFQIIFSEEQITIIDRLLICFSVIFLTFIIIFPVRNDKLLNSKKKNELFRLSKTVFANILIKSIDRRINYYPTKKQSNKIIKQCKLFKSKVDKANGSDLMTLEIENHILELSWLQLKNNAKTIFSGVLVHIKSSSLVHIDDYLQEFEYTFEKNIVDDNLYLSIPVKSKSFLNIELKQKENDLTSIINHIELIEQIFFLFKHLFKIDYLPIEHTAKEELMKKYAIEYKEEDIKYAFGNSRLINFLIDSFILGVLSIIVLIFFVIGGIVKQEDSYIILLIYLFVYLLYYISYEYMAGQTIGKLITKTKVVNIEDDKPSFGQIVVRTVCRLIPFEIYSFIGGDIGWHDRFSKTRVVYKRKNTSS